MASNLQLRIAHLEPQTLTIGKDTRVAALEFCVHGIVVHLRLGLSGALTGCMLNWMIAVLAIGGLQPATETLLTITWQLA